MQVNNNNNVAIYTASGAAVGGIAGGKDGYLSRPFLKNGEPTDTFVRKVNENINKLPEAQAGAQAGYNLAEQQAVAKNVDELAAITGENIRQIYSQFPDLNTAKETMIISAEAANQLGIEHVKVEDIVNAQSIDDLVKINEDFIKTKFAGMTMDEINAAGLAKMEEIANNHAKNIMNAFWDSEKKTFINCEESVGKAVKDAAQSIKWKTAGIYGAIGAAVLGLATFIGTKIAGNKQNHSDTIDLAQAGLNAEKTQA